MFDKPVIAEKLAQVKGAPLDPEGSVGFHGAKGHHPPIHRCGANVGMGVNRPFGKVDFPREEITEALEILERLDGLPKDRYVGSLYRAFVWLGLGEKNKALENLEKAYLERESTLAYIKVWPFCDSLRQEPRFQALLKKMKLDQ